MKQRELTGGSVPLVHAVSTCANQPTCSLFHHALLDCCLAELYWWGATRWHVWSASGSSLECECPLKGCCLHVQCEEKWSHTLVPTTLEFSACLDGEPMEIARILAMSSSGGRVLHSSELWCIGCGETSMLNDFSRHLVPGCCGELALIYLHNSTLQLQCS